MKLSDRSDRGGRAEGGALLCCGVVPLRLGVFLVGLLSVLWVFLVMLARSCGIDTRVLFGGYVLETRVISGFIEITGPIWGLFGMKGAWDCHYHSVRVFFIYQVLRCIAWFCVLVFDMPALWYCELWTADIANAGEWNPRMYEVAMHGECRSKRFMMCMCSSLCLGLFMYFTYVNHTYMQMLNQELPFLIRDKLPQRGFVAQSLAEYTPLTWPRQADTQRAETPRHVHYSAPARPDARLSAAEAEYAGAQLGF